MKKLYVILLTLIAVSCQQLFAAQASAPEIASAASGTKPESWSLEMHKQAMVECFEQLQASFADSTGIQNYVLTKAFPTSPTNNSEAQTLMFGIQGYSGQVAGQYRSCLWMLLTLMPSSDKSVYIRDLELQRLWVHNEDQNKKIGSALFNCAKSIATRLRQSMHWVASPSLRPQLPRLIKFYKNHGATIIGHTTSGNPTMEYVPKTLKERSPSVASGTSAAANDGKESVTHGAAYSAEATKARGAGASDFADPLYPISGLGPDHSECTLSGAYRRTLSAISDSATASNSVKATLDRSDSRATPGHPEFREAEYRGTTDKNEGV